MWWKFWFFELKDGNCKSCINKQTPPCHGCYENFNESELKEGYCSPCYKQLICKKEKEAEERKRIQKSNEIILTTETNPNIKIEKRIEIITAECAFGMNIFKDIFAGVRDIVGGRSKGTQDILRDARKTVLKELRKEAYLVGANAVIAVDLDYSEFSGGGKSMLFVVASGTAVEVSSDE